MTTDYQDLLLKVIPKFEELLDTYVSNWKGESYIKVVSNAMEKEYNAFSILLTFEMILQHYLSDCKLSLVDIIMKRDSKTLGLISNANELVNMLNDSTYYQDKSLLKDDIKSFMDKVYKRDKMDLDELFDKGEKLYDILSKHFNTLEDMELHQFSKGKATHAAPQFVTNINCFRSMNEALHSLNKIKMNFIALVGIKNEESHETGSFAYIVRNGDNLYAFSDIKRQDGTDGTFSGRRDVYADLMPYVHLKEFQYVWYILFDDGTKYPINTDKYYLARDDKDWKNFHFNELEPDEILFQYFMFEYMKREFFGERKKEHQYELSYNSSAIALTYKGKTINKTQLPILYNEFESIEVEAPSISRLLEEQYQILLEENKGYNPHETWGYTTRRDAVYLVIRPEYIHRAYQRAKQKLNDPLTLLRFTYSDFNAVDYKGTVYEAVVRDYRFGKQHEIIKPLSSEFFGTEGQYREYMDNLQKANMRRLLVEEINEIGNELIKPFAKFMNYLFTSKFKNLIIEKGLKYALTDNEHGVIRERKFSEASGWRTNREWETMYYPIWEKNLRYDWKATCALTGSKRPKYCIELGRMRTAEDIIEFWNLSYGELPEYIKMFNGEVQPSRYRSELKLSIENVINNSEELFWISHSGLKKYCKDNNIEFDYALSKIKKYDPKKGWY